MAKTVQAGKAGIELGVIDKTERGLRSASKKMKKWGGSLLKAGAALTGGIVGLMGGPVLLASQAEEAMAKFGTVFGANTQVMKEWSDTTAQAMGVAKVEMANMLGSMQDLLIPMGVAEDAATDMNKAFAQLSVDLASFNSGQGITVDQAFRDITAAVSGSPETMKKYGVVINETLLKQEALTLGLVDSIKVLNPAQKAQAAYSLIMKNTTAAQGDAIRTQGSFANQLKRLKANALDIGAALGQSLLQPLSKVGQVINQVAKNVKGWIDENPGLVKGLTMAAAAVGGLGVGLLALGGTLTVIGFALGGLATGLGFILSPLGLLIGGLVVGVAAVAKFTNFFGMALDWLQDRFGPLVDTVKDSMAVIGEAFNTGNLTGAWEIAIETMEFLWLDLTMGIRQLWFDAMNYLSSISTEVVAGIGKMFQKLADFLRALMDRYKAYYNSVYNWVTEKIGEASGVRTIGGPVDAFSGGAIDNFTSNLADGMENFGSTLEDTARGMHADRVAQRQARMEELKRRRDALSAGIKDQGDAARAAKKAREQLTADTEGLGDVQNMLGQMGQALMAGGGAGPTGTFSAAAAAISGGAGNYQARMMKVAEKSLAKQAEIAKNTKDNVAKVGP